MCHREQNRATIQSSNKNKSEAWTKRNIPCCNSIHLYIGSYRIDVDAIIHAPVVVFVASDVLRPTVACAAFLRLAAAKHTLRKRHTRETWTTHDRDDQTTRLKQHQQNKSARNDDRGTRTDTAVGLNLVSISPFYIRNAVQEHIYDSTSKACVP